MQNQKDLIIVESPNKIKTIQSYVGDKYNILATSGHLRELNKKKGYDEEFNPIWSVITDSKKQAKVKAIISDIKKHAKDANKIYLATDPDREGEAISWHVWDILSEKDKKKCERITFNEVTKNAILEAIKNKSEINFDLVHSQFTRRIIDRMIGYKLSNYVRRNLNAISAGRVQSVALLFIVERELERRKFVPSSWWEIEAKIFTDVKLSFVDLDKKFTPYKDAPNSLKKFKFGIKEEAEKVYKSLGHEFELVKKAKPSRTTGEAHNPLTTDKLLQIAATTLGWSAKKTTSVAQVMFEGVEIDNKQTALISYPRTDSQRLSEDFIKESKVFIEKEYGPDYYEGLKATVKSKQKIQDAHEAIRPIDLSIVPSTLNLTAGSRINASDIQKLYELVWNRTLMSLMKKPIFLNCGLYFKNNGHDFFTNHKTIEFDGYLVLSNFKKLREELSKTFPDLTLNTIYKTKDTVLSEHEKQPPPYYTEATLIAALKESGVGRPSTYSSMARIGEERGYVVNENKKLIPNELGMSLIESLVKNFSKIISKKFTAEMEVSLDKISVGEYDWKERLNKFSPIFEKELQDAYSSIVKKEDELVNRKCPDCSKELVYKISRYQKKFIGCSGFPACKHLESIEKPVYLEEKCPQCSSQLIERKSKKGQEFIGCSGFPKCRFIKSKE